RRRRSSSSSSGASSVRMALAISSCVCGVLGTALSLRGSGGFIGLALCDTSAPRSLERDVDGAQPAVGAIDFEADGPALEQRAGVRRQVGAMHEHVARAVVAGEKAVAFGVVEKLDLAGDAHGSSSDALMKPARMGARPPGASRAGAASRVVREVAVV